MLFAHDSRFCAFDFEGSGEGEVSSVMANGLKVAALKVGRDETNRRGVSGSNADEIARAELQIFVAAETLKLSTFHANF